VSEQGDKGAGESGGDDKGKGAAPDKGPAPVPYDVFKATNDRLRGVEAEHAKLQEKLKSYEGWKAPAEVEQVLAAERAAAKVQVLLADGGVQPQYRDYMLGRLTSTKPEDPAAYLALLKTSEPAFFGPGSPTSTPAGGTTTTPPRTNPDGKGGTTAPGDGRPVTASDIDAMSVEQYAEWKKAGGLQRLRASST
jgi:hypothetical protein